jgi:phage/plasmid-like protein (TIGR03299 family)
MQIEQLLEKSGTNWTVSKRPLFGPDGEPTSGYGIFRDDSNSCLGIVGSVYTITQNSEVVELLLEAADKINIKASRGGHLGGGKRVYYQFELPNVQIGGSNTMRYLTGLSAHDGLTKIGFGATNVVVVCANTFFRALRDCSTVKHTKTHKTKLLGIISTLRESLAHESMMIENMIELSRTTVPSIITDDYLVSLIGGNVESSRTQNRLNELKGAIRQDYEIHGETAWGLFNGVTRYTNHMVKYNSIDNKRASLMFGSAAKVNNSAYLSIISEYAPHLLEKEVIVPPMAIEEAVSSDIELTTI